MLTPLCLLSLLTACGLAAGPTPDTVATQMAMNTALAARQTARPRSTSTATPGHTPTPSPPATPATWERFESEEHQFALEYPARCLFEPMLGWGWQVIDQEQEQAIAIAIFDDPSPAWRDMPLPELATTAASKLLTQNGESLDDFQFVSSSLTDDYGPPAAAVRYDSLDGDIAFEMLVIRAPGRIWTFFFAAHSLDGWFERTRDSISVTDRSVFVSPSPRPAPPTRLPAPSPTSSLAGVGQPTDAGDWEFTVTEVQYHKALYFRNRSRVAMGVYCVLFVDVENHATGTTSFGDLGWCLRSADGELHCDDAATFTAAWQFGGKDLPWTDLDPGQSARIVIAYDVGQGARGLQFFSRRLGQPYVHIGDAQPPKDQG